MIVTLINYTKDTRSMLIGRQYYMIKCDAPGCEELCPHKDCEVSAYPDPAEVLDMAKDCDWLLIGGEHYCFDHAVFCVACEDVIVPSMIMVCNDCARKGREALAKQGQQGQSPTAEGK